MNNNGQYFDGVPVTLHDGKFSGTFTLPDDLGDQMRYDDVVTFLVTAVVGPAKVGSNAAGDMKRTNTLIVSSSHYVDESIVDAVRNNVVYAGQSAPQVVEVDEDDEDDESFLKALGL
jgi:hypothetical protein